nr:apolipoprotein N-acyltransferase [uncultured Celeribacter sp.]
MIRGLPSRLRQLFTLPHLAAFGAGMLVALGQASFGLWPLAVLGLIFSVILWNVTPTARASAACGWWVGFGAFLVSLSWLVNPFLVEPWRYGWMIPFALLAMCGGLALFWSLAFYLARRLALGLFGLVAFWGLAELARGHVFTGFPWAMPAYIWLDTPMAQVSAVVGPYGLTFLSFAVAALMAKALMRRSLWIGGLAALGFAGMFALGDAMLLREVPADRTVKVRVVQPNAPQHLKWDPEHLWQFYDRALSLTPPEGADLVIWPETSVAVPLYAAGPELAEIAAAAAPARAMVGLNRVDGMQGYNTAVLIDETGAPVASYDKHHLVPFGEYMPLPGLLERIGLRAFTATNGYGYSAGEGPHLLDTGVLGQVLPLICYEAIFPRDLRTVERPDWLLQMTNDAWFGTFSGPQQSLAQARFRAIETGLPMVRAANTGISAVIGPLGDVRVALPLGTSGAFTENLPAALPLTPYARWGERPMFGLLGVFFIAGLLRLLWRVRAKRD